MRTNGSIDAEGHSTMSAHLDNRAPAGFDRVIFSTTSLISCVARDTCDTPFKAKRAVDLVRIGDSGEFSLVVARADGAAVRVELEHLLEMMNTRLNDVAAPVAVEQC